MSVTLNDGLDGLEDLSDRLLTLHMNPVAKTLKMSHLVRPSSLYTTHMQKLGRRRREDEPKLVKLLNNLPESTQGLSERLMTSIHILHDKKHLIL